MKANEIQIGDYVNYRGQIIKVTSLYDKGGSNEVGWSNKESVWVNGINIEPIPITAEMLSKLGFKKKGNRYGIYDDYFDFEMHEYNDGMWLVSYHCCEMSLPDEQLLICYIHQLQHFMRHCGIEKTIEE